MRPRRLTDARALLPAALALALVAAATGAERAGGTPAVCAPRLVSPSYERSLARTLGSGRDVLGERLLRLPGGPTYAAAARLVPPLLFARTSKQRALTSSGVYYVPSAQPAGAQGAGAPMLLLADGSEVRYGSVGGPSLRVSVAGGERFGSCLRRAGAARLAAGYLPIVADLVRRRARDALPPGGLRGSPAGWNDSGVCPCDRRQRSHRWRCGQPARALGAAALTASATDRRRRVRASARSGRPLLASAARRGRVDHGAGAARGERGARVADPEPDADVALQHRQPVRGVLVPGESRRRAGAGRVRVRRRRPGDRAHVPHTPSRPLPRLEDGREAARRGDGVSADGQRRVRRCDDAGVAQLRRCARAFAARGRNARSRALLVGHPGSRARPARAGNRLPGAARHGSRVVTDG